MKKTILLICASILLVAAILFVPIPRGQYNDGGTRHYSALTYELVDWQRVFAEPGGQSGVYKRTVVYWFSESDKIDDLWKLEMEAPDEKCYNYMEN